MLDSVMWRMILIENLSTSSSIFQLRSLKKGHIDFHNGFSLKKKSAKPRTINPRSSFTG